jgi:hypothetical protein
MKTYAYNVVAIYDDCEIEVKTNSADTAICALLEHTENGVPVHVMNGCTGEILVCTDPEDYWVTEEWSLMIIGWLMKTMWEIGG